MKRLHALYCLFVHVKEQGYFVLTEYQLFDLSHFILLLFSELSKPSVSSPCVKTSLKTTLRRLLPSFSHIHAISRQYLNLRQINASARVILSVCAW